ncbi:MAG: hypothetical protein V4819_05695 [Verrucomicrobiota bacterium]
MTFTGGNFDINFSDGSVLSIGGCNFLEYYPPAFFLGICSPGTTGFLTSGTIDGATLAFPYLLVTAVNPALAVAPRRAELVKLTAAPASGLPRPSGGFTDRSASLYFNLHVAGSLREYVLTRYESKRSYDKGEGEKFLEQIVPGVYHYAFPRLGFPELPASIAATIYPMAEGFAERNNVEQGFKFTDVNGSNFSKDGFVELSYMKPNIIQWNPLPSAIVFPGVDDLFFSIRVIADQENPKSRVVYEDKYSNKLQSIFPAFQSDGDPKVVLPSPLVSQFITPPVIAGGTKGVIEVELGRNFQTGGVTYDFSNRKFQLPVVVVNRYSEYQEIVVAKSKSNSDILKDTDNDGFNNLNEWILGSSAVDAESTPIPPTAANVPTLYDFDYLDYFFLFGTYRIVRPQYYGFTIDQKLGTKPGVVYTLQRSKDKGKTWKKFVTDADWTVRKVKLAPGEGSVDANSPRRVQIWVESKVLGAGTLGAAEYVAPPGTQSDRYRVKITLAK